MARAAILPCHIRRQALDTHSLVSRRTLLTGALSLLLADAVRAQTVTATRPRAATLDWALLETLLALRANVVAAPELRQFHDVAVEPSVPASIADLGLRGLPNLETLFFSRPDIIFNSNFYAWADPLLSRIAPTSSFGIYVTGADPYTMAERATHAMGQGVDLASGAQAYVEQTAQMLADLRHGMEKGDRRSILLINLGDARHYRVFGADSMFGSTLTRMGLDNAWKGHTAYSAAAPMGIETLASMPDAWIVFIPPHPADAFASLQRSSFWNELPAVRQKRVIMLGSINPYGALPAARRFAGLLAKGLTDAWKS